MLAEAMQHVPQPLVALAVTRYGNDRTISGATVLTASHPEPDEAGLAAGRRIIELDRQRSNAALAAAGDLLTIGATGTNVADVQVMLLAGADG